jgi:hypothetical protein
MSLLYCRYVVTFTKVLTMYQTSICPSVILLHPSSPIQWSHQDSFFHCHTWVYNISTVFTSYTLSYLLPPTNQYNLQTGPDLLSCSQFLRFWHFCSSYLYREFHYDISRYMCIVSQMVHPLHFSPFYLSPLLTVISTGLSVLYSFLYRKHITHVHLLSFLLLPSLFR